MYGRTCVLCAAMAFAVPTSAAQEIIEEVIVRAAPLERSTEELTQSAQVLAGDDLMRRAQQTIGETLANELGVSASYFGPAASRPIIRGQSGPRVSVREDGISTLDVSDLSADHAIAVEPLLARRIEIIRGPATLLYGSSAAGGVVNVIDNRVPEFLEANTGAIEARYESASQERAVVARADGSGGAIGWHADGFRRSTNDVDIASFATSDPSERPANEPRGRLANSYSESFGYAVGASVVAQAGFLGAAASVYDNEYGLPGPGEEGDASAGGPHIELRQKRVDLRGAIDLDAPIETIKLRAGRNDYEHTEFEPDGAPGTRFENDAWETHIEFVHAPLRGWRGAVGIQIGDRDFAAIGEEAFVPPTQTRSTGVFAVEERVFGDWRVELAARGETVRHEPRGGFESFDESALSIAAGVVWDITSEFDLSANLSRTERLPAAEELYSNGPHLASGLFEIGIEAQGLALNEETAVNLDVALHHHSERWSWQVSAFYNAVADYIYLADTDVEMEGLPVGLYVQDDATLLGVEAEALLPVLSKPNGSLDLRLFTDVVRGRTDDGDLPRLPPWRMGAQLRWESAGWFASLGAIHHARQDDVSSFATGAFTLVSADITRDIEGGGRFAWQVFGSLSNLLDEDARRSTSIRAAYVPIMGRSVRIGVRMLVE